MPHHQLISVYARWLFQDGWFRIWSWSIPDNLFYRYFVVNLIALVEAKEVNVPEPYTRSICKADLCLVRKQLCLQLALCPRIIS